MRGDHGEVAQLLMHHGGKVFKNSENRLVELNRSSLAGCAAWWSVASGSVCCPPAHCCPEGTSGRWGSMGMTRAGHKAG